MGYKAICTDIDGTLLDNRRELSFLTIETFRRLPPDIPVFLASSRMPSAMRHLQEQLGILHHPLICYNGGYVIQYSGNDQANVLDSVFISADLCNAIVRQTLKTNVHVSLYYEDNWYAPRWDYWAEREARITKVRPQIADLNDVLERWEAQKIGGHKVMCMGSEEEINILEASLKRSYPTQLHVYRSRPTYLEIAPGAISKGSALKLLLKKYPIEISEVISFGDNYNDIDLLKVSGKGVAVENAREEVKAIADEITLDSKDNGVAISLHHHFSQSF
jgi:Cof subfamily protein (haloacid dehalogenase superfamily)